MTPTRRAALVVVLTVALAACTSTDRADDAGSAGESPGASPSPTATPEATETPASGTDVGTSPVGAFTCEEETAEPGGGVWFLKEVRQASHDGFDRVVFDLEAGPGASGLPGWVAKPALPPFAEDPSDQPLEVPGSTAIQVTLTNTSGVDLSQATPRIVYEGPSSIDVDDEGPLRGIVEGGDFEATMTWYLGVGDEPCFAVATFDSPTRLVVDVRGR